MPSIRLNNNGPCHGCENRKHGCHSACARYRVYRIMCDLRLEKATTIARAAYKWHYDPKKG